MTKRFLIIPVLLLATQGCAKKVEMQPIIEEDSKIEIVEQQESRNQVESKVEESEKVELQISDKDLEHGEKQQKPVMVAVMAPMTGKYDMLGKAIMDGAQMSVIKLFDKHGVPVRIQVIDTGSNVEDIEFNLSKLEENDFDIVMGLTSDEQEKFAQAHVQNSSKKPTLITFNPFSYSNVKNCAISPKQQMQAVLNVVNAEVVYVLQPATEKQDLWEGHGVQILQYSTRDVNETNSDLKKIVETITNDDKKSVVVFTEANWKLQKFMGDKPANVEKIVLASLSNLNGRMQSVAEKRHKFGEVSVVVPDKVDYKQFPRDFYRINQRKPLELSFLAYNAIQDLKEWKQGEIVESLCKIPLRIVEKENNN